MDVKRLQSKLREFSEERDWKKFHNPKNLAVALSVECSELLEIFQWLTDSESSLIMSTSRSGRVQEELADAFAYMLMLSDALGVDLEKAILQKMKRNAEKYPIKEFHGSARKYNEKDLDE